MNKVWLSGVVIAALDFGALLGPACSQTAGAQTVVSVASNVSASDAQRRANLAITDVAKSGWVAINVSGADMFTFVLTEAALSSGGVQGNKEYDVYLLLTCHPIKGKVICPPPIILPGP